MKTKYFNNLMMTVLVCCGIAAAVTSCRFEDEDYFDQPAALRIDETAKAIQETLVSAPNGWVMQYFVAGTDEQSFEGFNIFAKFENNQKVTLAGDHRFLRNDNAGKYTEYSSLYEILKEDGPVLAFNTWNDILTPFVDPVDPAAAPKSIVKDGEGMGGDHNLVVLSYGKDEVLLRGERHSARVRLIPSPGTWQEYIDATNKLKSYITNTSITSYYVISDAADTLFFKNLRSGVITYCERINDPLFPTTLNCVFTPDGFRLHHRNTIGDVPFQEFKMAADSTCLVSENDSVRVIPCWDNYLINRTAVWKMDETKFSAAQQNLRSQIEEELKKYNANCSVASIGIGKSSGAGSVIGLVVTFYTNAARTKTNTFGLSMDITKPAFGQSTIKCDENNGVDNNLKAINTKATNMESLIRQFAATLVGTYNMTPDNSFLPTAADYTPVSGGTAFTLVK